MELEAVIPIIPMTQSITRPAPVMDMGADKTMLRLGVGTMDPSSDDERTAKHHVYQTPLVLVHGQEPRDFNVSEGFRDIDDSRYNQRSNVNTTSLFYTSASNK